MGRIAYTDDVPRLAEGGSASDAFALAAAKAMCQGGSGASAVAQAISQAISQGGCSAIQPILASEASSIPPLD